LKRAVFRLHQAHGKLVDPIATTGARRRIDAGAGDIFKFGQVFVNIRVGFSAIVILPTRARPVNAGRGGSLI
jgi:hypothetical protein